MRDESGSESDARAATELILHRQARPRPELLEQGRNAQRGHGDEKYREGDAYTQEGDGPAHEGSAVRDVAIDIPQEGKHAGSLGLGKGNMRQTRPGRGKPVSAQQQSGIRGTAPQENRPPPCTVAQEARLTRMGARVYLVRHSIEAPHTP